MKTLRPAFLFSQRRLYDQLVLLKGGMILKKIKILSLLIFIGLAFVGLFNNNQFIHTATASSSGPPPGVSGAPGESTCTACHVSQNPGAGQFTVTAPTNYNPGQIYQIEVRHTTADMTRQRWGFQITALAGQTMAGTFADLNANTQTLNGGNGRFYTEQTLTGSFAGQTGGAVWTFNWTAPATDVGAVTFYAAGNQADNNGSTSGDWIFTTTAMSQPAPVVTEPTVFDFDGDGKTDVSVFRPSDRAWYVLNSSAGFSAAQFGNSDDKLVPADFDGDGKTDLGVFRGGNWYLQRSMLGFIAVSFGNATDISVPADYDGDGKAELAVYRPSDGTWYILNLVNNQFSAVQFGNSTDKPVPADFDGDGKADIAVFRPAEGVWYLLRSTQGFAAVQFGVSTDKPVVGDYDGDGKADIAVFRPSDGTWYVLGSAQGFSATRFGISTDLPVPGDYDGDGKTDLAVFRDGNWFQLKSTQGFAAVQFGATGDKPVPNAFVP